MSIITRTQNTYDHRLKDLVRSTGKIDVAIQRGVPRSTARGWLTKAPVQVITLDVLEMDAAQLQREVVSLWRRNARLIALLRLIVTVMKVTGFTLSRVRLPEESAKRRVLRAIGESRAYFPLKAVLRVSGLSYGRYREWNRFECGLDDLPSCPKSSPQQLTAAEVATIHEMVTSDEYRHVTSSKETRVKKPAIQSTVLMSITAVRTQRADRSRQMGSVWVQAASFREAQIHAKIVSSYYAEYSGVPRPPRALRGRKCSLILARRIGKKSGFSTAKWAP